MDMNVNISHKSARYCWTTVCLLDELAENSGQCALVNEKQIAIFRLADVEEIFAMDNFDPFSQANVLSRGVVGDLQGELVVASPVYKQHFKLADGQCLEDTSVRVASYATRVLHGAVQVAVE